MPTFGSGGSTGEGLIVATLRTPGGARVATPLAAAVGMARATSAMMDPLSKPRVANPQRATPPKITSSKHTKNRENAKETARPNGGSR